MTWRFRLDISAKFLIVLSVGVCMFGALFLLLPSAAYTTADAAYNGISFEELQAFNPRLAFWLTLVFRVYGSSLIGNGIMMAFVARNAYARGETWAWRLLALVPIIITGPPITVAYVISDTRLLVSLLSMMFAYGLAIALPSQHFLRRQKTAKN